MSLSNSLAAQLQCARLLANLAQLADHRAWVSSSSAAAVMDSDKSGQRYNVVEQVLRWIALPYQQQQRATPDAKHKEDDEKERRRDVYPRLQKAALQTLAKLSFDEEGFHRTLHPHPPPLHLPPSPSPSPLPPSPPHTHTHLPLP